MSQTITQLLVPQVIPQYKAFDLTNLIMAEQGLALPPWDYLTQRGPYQHGDTVVGMRLNPRTVQLALAKYHDTELAYYLTRNEWITLFSSINTGDVLTPIYPYVLRKIINQRREVLLDDLMTTAGSAVVTSANARFVQHGLSAGQTLVILDGPDNNPHTIASVSNENRLTLDAALTSTGQVHCSYCTAAIVRDLDVFIDDAPHLDVSHVRFTRSNVDVLRLVAHNPVWRDAFIQTSEWVVDIAGNLIFYESPDWVDRAVFPIWFSGDFIASDLTLSYVGTWPTRPTITLNGPFTLFKLVNTSTSDQLILNYAAVQGEQVIIDMAALRAYNQLGVDLTNYLYNSVTQDSDLVTFQLAPHPIVPDGRNILHVEVNNAMPQVTSVVMTWQSWYIGV